MPNVAAAKLIIEKAYRRRHELLVFNIRLLNRNSYRNKSGFFTPSVLNTVFVGEKQDDAKTKGEKLKFDTSWNNNTVVGRGKDSCENGVNIMLNGKCHLHNPLIRTPAADRCQTIHDVERLMDFGQRLQFVYDDILRYPDQYPPFVQKMHFVAERIRQQQRQNNSSDQTVISYGSNALFKAKKVVFAIFYLGFPTSNIAILTTRLTVIEEMMDILHYNSNQDIRRHNHHPVLMWIHRFGTDGLYVYALESIESSVPSTYSYLSSRRKLWWQQKLSTLLRIS